MPSIDDEFEEWWDHYVWDQSNTYAVAKRAWVASRKGVDCACKIDKAKDVDQEESAGRPRQAPTT